MSDAPAPAPHDFASMTVREFCTALAAKSPTPGGGAVAGVSAAQAAALLAMVIEFSRGKKSFASWEGQAEAMLAALRLDIDAALVGARNDSDAYSRLSALWKKPADDPERVAGWATAVRGAIAAPQFIVDLASELTARCAQLVGTTAKYLDSDLAVATDLAACAARAAACNVRANVPLLGDPVESARTLERLNARLAVTQSDVAAVHAALATRS